MGERFDIRIDDLTGPEIAALLQEHLEFAAKYSPPESIHALDLDALRAPEITFWSVWQDDMLVGCGALKEINAGHAEIKSMRTANGHQREGVARALLSHMLTVARERGYEQVSLETGSQDAFVPARALYAKFGFEPCEPFAAYCLDHNSVFMTLRLES